MSAEKVCAVCGKPLPPRRFTYCSDVCSRIATNQRKRALSTDRHGPKPKTIICPDCGMEAQVYSKSYRCPECQAAANARANAEFKKRKAAGKTRPIGSTDICQRCGQLYTVESGLQKYCDACATIALQEHNRAAGLAAYHKKYDGAPEQREQRNIKRRLPRYSPIQCRVCGREFIPETNRSAFCSPKCADAAHKQQTLQWNQENKKRKAEYMRGYRAWKKEEKNHAE